MAVQISGNDITVPRDTTVTRNLTVGGVLTYEDVTNVDSIGIVTARAGVLVGSGITLSKDGDIFATGVTTSTTFSGNFSGGTVSGTTGTFTGDVDIADKIVHTGDTNTALRFPAADTITAETGGSERLRIDSKGQLSSGGSTTAFDGTSSLNGLQMYYETDSGLASFGSYSSGGGTNLAFYTNSGGSAATEKLRIDYNGNVGMGGNTNPTNVLHIKTAATNTAVATIESTATNSYPFLRLKNDAREYQLTCHGGLSDAFTIYDGTASAHRFLIDSSGRILQGSSTGRNTALMAAQPTYQLEGTSSNTSNFGIFCNSNGSAAGGIEFGKTRGSAVGGTTVVQENDSLGHISFEGSDGSAQRVGARITAAVDGTPGSSDMPGRLMFFTTPDGSATESERLRIGSEGNLALGGTNTEGYSNQSNFFIGGVGNIYADNGTGSGRSLSISNNAYINAAGNWVYRSTDKASNIYQYDGIIGFRTVASGTAGNTISWSEKVRITNDGKLLVGATSSTASPSSGTGYDNVCTFNKSGITITQYSVVASIMYSGIHFTNSQYYVTNNSGTGVYLGSGNTSWTAHSDERLKINIAELDGTKAYNHVKTARASSFNWNVSGYPTDKKIGFIAQDWETNYPELVNSTTETIGDVENPKGIQYTETVPVLMAALKEAIAKIETLETEVAALKSN